MEIRAKAVIVEVKEEKVEALTDTSQNRWSGLQSWDNYYHYGPLHRWGLRGIINRNHTYNFKIC